MSARYPARRRQRPYWPRYFVVTDVGWNCSHKDSGTAQEHARSMRRAGWNCVIIQASSREDALQRSQPHWNKCAS